MSRNQRLQNQDKIIDKLQSRILETLSKENMEATDFQKLQYLSLSLRAVSEATKHLNTLP
jgi:hypothetical protein